MPTLIGTSEKYNSIYDLHTDFSYKNEEFYEIPIYWRSQIEALKIRVANWKPKLSRENSAVFYYEVKTHEEAKHILKHFESFNFKELQDKYELMWNQDNFENKGYFNTGETSNWIQNIFLPKARQLYIAPI